MAPIREGASRARRRSLGVALAVAALLASGHAESRRADEDGTGGSPTATLQAGSIQRGRISWYGRRADSRPTASGEPLDDKALTMAHPTLPFGSIVRVTNLRNRRSVVVRVNDRGPGIAGRIADVSHAAARKLGMIGHGVVRARLEVLSLGDEDTDEDAGEN